MHAEDVEEQKEVHRGFRCTPRMAGSGGGFTMRDTVSCTSAGAGRTGLPWGRRERQADGKPGRGSSAFFLKHLSRRSPPRLTIPASSDARSREPSPRANLFGNAPGLLAGPGFARSRIGGSWRPAPAHLRQEVGAGLGRGWRDRYLPKNSHGPLPRFHPSAVPDASTHALSNPHPPPCPDTIPLHRGSSRPWRASRAVCNQIRDEPRKRTRMKVASASSLFSSASSA
jgi:hypothetical protein